MQLWSFAVIVAAGCGRLGFDAVGGGGDGGPGDGAGDGDAGLGPTGPFVDEAIIANLSSPAADDDPALSPDGLELYFSSDRSGGVGSEDIWASVRSSRSVPWPAPTPVTAVNSTGNDKGPSVSGDGLELWFSSNIGSGYELYVSTRSTLGAPWSAPVKVAELSTTFGSGTPHRLGNRVVFRSHLANSTSDLMQSLDTGSSWGGPQLISELATAFNESSPELAAGGNRIYFDSNRSGDYEIYVADRDPMTTLFGPPVPLAGISSAGNESDAALSADQRIIVFSRNGMGGDREVWMATR
jgi:Tol biopolymer transport system component